MKKSKYLVFVIALFFCLAIKVNAAPSYSFYTSTSSVENGKTVTASVTIKNVAAWNVKIISAGNTNGCSQSFADATANGGNTTKTLSVTCKATSLGTISFTLRGDVTSSDGANINISGSKSVKVVEPRPLSQNNYLASIAVEGYEIKPAFNEEVYEYSVTVPNTINAINLVAKAKDRYASVAGNGTFEVSEGSNPFTITVTAENGAKREYKLDVIVEDVNPIVIHTDKGEAYTIIKNIKNVETPELFTPSTLSIEGIEAPVFVSEVSNFVLLPVKSDEGKVLFVIVNSDGTYTLYRSLRLGGVLFYFMSSDDTFDDYENSVIEFADFQVDGLQSKTNNDYYLVYGMNMETGSASWYRYDSKEGTIQRFDAEGEKEQNKKFNDLEKKNKQYFVVVIVFGAGLLLAIIITIITFISFSKKRKKLNTDYLIKLKDMEIKQIQGDSEKQVVQGKRVKKGSKKAKEEVKKEPKEETKEEKELEKTREFNKDLVSESENSSLLSNTVEIDEKDLEKIQKKGSKKK